jgi:hypothetical protein
VAAGVFVGIELVVLGAFGRLEDPRQREEPELEAGPEGLLVDAAVSILVACWVEAARSMMGFGFWLSNTGS